MTDVGITLVRSDRKSYEMHLAAEDIVVNPNWYRSFGTKHTCSSKIGKDLEFPEIVY